MVVAHPEGVEFGAGAKALGFRHARSFGELGPPCVGVAFEDSNRSHRRYANTVAGP
jgi:hypothetical protein